MAGRWRDHDDTTWDGHPLSLHCAHGTGRHRLDDALVPTAEAGHDGVALSRGRSRADAMIVRARRDIAAHERRLVGAIA